MNAQEPALEQRALPVVRAPESTAHAIERLLSVAQRARGLGLVPLYFLSTAPTEQDAVRLDEHFRASGNVDASRQPQR